MNGRVPSEGPRPHVSVMPPGPKSLALWDRRRQTIANANYTGLYGIALTRGDQVWIEDADGNVYLDCLSCASSTILGYGQEFLAAAYYAQAQRLQQSCFTYSLNEPALDLAERLISLAPGDFPKRVLIGLSGSDSCGGAIKASRKFTGIAGIIHFKNDYHGSTGLSQQASDFGALNDGIYSHNAHFIELDFPRTSAQSEEVLNRIEVCLRRREAGGVICEPIQGDAGAVVPAPGFLAGLRRVTADTGSILILDEVQSGMGRTGRWWALSSQR